MITEDWYKHRAWDVVNKVMHYEFEWMTVKDKNSIIVQSDILPFPYGQWPPEYDVSFGTFMLMETTKVRDKNNKIIYNSDLVKVIKDGKEFIGLVTFNIGGCPYATNREGDFCYFDNATAVFEVIGNIYETPELIPPKVVFEIESVKNKSND